MKIELFFYNKLTILTAASAFNTKYVYMFYSQKTVQKKFYFIKNEFCNEFVFLYNNYLHNVISLLF